MGSPLIIKEEHLYLYTSIKNQDISNYNQVQKITYNLAIMALTSKQCNEPYESLISLLLGLNNILGKHGLDGVSQDGMEVFEYKPSTLDLKKKNPTGTINDDSEEKIKKCEDLPHEGKKGWLILAGLNKEEYTIDCIYKFPLEIYTNDRRDYLNKTIQKNKNKDKQTRSTYSISVPKSIGLCKEFNKDYYVWKRD